MLSATEKKRRRDVKISLKNAERTQFIASLPTSQKDLQDLLNHISEIEEPCDNTLKDSVAFIRKRNMPEDETIAWLNEHGGYCDCEVTFNVLDKWEQMIGTNES